MPRCSSLRFHNELMPGYLRSTLPAMSNGSSSASGTSMSFLPYEEPAITSLLTLASFVLVLNGVNAVLDRVLYCGLVGQILIGVAWGTPGGDWLPLDTQKTIVQLGYVGLILMVYEGGLSTSVSSVRQNAWLSLSVATTGILLPIALSFSLMPILGVSSLQAFSAGAALCSTSLGTTFTVLSTCDLVSTRLGTVLTTAAMLDDVVGLVMVQIVSNFGASGNGPTDIETIIRPLGVSVGVVAFLVLLCHYVLLPLSRVLVPSVRMLLSIPMFSFVAQSLVLLGIFAGASFAGTSGLFAAYLAGASLTWWDKTFAPGLIDFAAGGGKNAEDQTGLAVYDSNYATVTNLLLKPLFFASIGFSIPISQLFRVTVVWRGLVYSFLMLIAKAATGAWLLGRDSGKLHICKEDQPGRSVKAWPGNNSVKTRSIGSARRVLSPETQSSSGGSFAASLYPAFLLGSAMAARGEIGYLIASVAESSGVFTSDDDHPGGSEIFLVVIWAITLCTIIGPLAVGLLIRRVRRLEQEKGRQQGRRQALGKWATET